MRCLSCESGSTKVVDTRAARGGRAIRRRRECLLCGDRFTTYESVEQRPLQVLKRDGSAENFEREKLRGSVAVACARRPVSPSDVDRLVDRIEDAVSDSAGVEVSTEVIGEAVMEGLEPLDRVAYIRYASVYRNFQHIDEFQEAVDELNVKERRVRQHRFQGELLLGPDAPAPGEDR